MEKKPTITSLLASIERKKINSAEKIFGYSSDLANLIDLCSPMKMNENLFRAEFAALYEQNQFALILRIFELLEAKYGIAAHSVRTMNFQY